MSNDYPSDWNRRRKEVYKRDDYTCQNCGQQGGSHGSSELHAHHIVPKSKGGTHKKSNLKTVCKDCHQAIHNDSMAPSAEIPRTEHTTKLPLELTNYSYTVSTHVKCINETHRVFTRFEELETMFGDLLEYVELQPSVSAPAFPGHLKEHYFNRKYDLNTALDNLSGNIDSLESVDVDELPDKAKENYEEVVESLTKTTIDIVTFSETIFDIVEINAPAQSAYTELFVDRQTMTTSIEAVVKVAQNLLEILISEINNTMDGLEREANQIFSGKPFYNCPICQKTDGISNDEDFAIAHCVECQTEWQNQGFEWKVIHSTQDINEYEMAAAFWREVGKQGFNNPDELDPYVNQSEAYITRLKIILSGGIGIQVIVFAWIIASQYVWLMVVVSIIALAVNYEMHQELKSSIIATPE